MKKVIMYILGSISPKMVTHLLYFKAFKKIMNLKEPSTLNEKIQWLKFYGDISKWSLFSDKFRVREYVKEKGYGETLVKLYGYWRSADDINWETVPSRFVLKANNGCGDITICKDINLLDKIYVTNYYNKLMKDKFGITTGQTHYQNIQPLIIMEELLDTKNQKISSTSLIDYKIWCFNGEPEFVLVCCNRTKNHLHVSLYDKNWKQCNEYMVFSKEFQRPPFDIPEPDNLQYMLDCSRALSKGHPQMRVDLYEVGGKVYFGELTMTSACGLMTYFSEEFLLKAGGMVSLPKK